MANFRDRQYSEEEMQELQEMMERLNRREAVRRHQEALSTEPPLAPSELISLEDEFMEGDLPFHLQSQNYDPNRLEAEDVRDLLIMGDDEDPLAETFHAESSANRAAAMVDEPLPEPPAQRRNPWQVLWTSFCGNFPAKGDSVGTKLRKCGFLTSVVVMLVALAYLLTDLLVIPAKNNQLKNELMNMYDPQKLEVLVVPEEEEGKCPEKMLASFKEFYDLNDEIRGWITYHAETGNKDFLDIDYPIVHSGDNEKYLRRDFYGEYSRNGTLFFDEKNKLNSYKDQTRSLIVYGHNMASGDMFAGLNKFLGSVNNARSAATLTMSTLYRQDTYVVFGVVLTDETDRKKGHYFNTRRVSFNTDEEFLAYVEEIRARSLFDYPVDVRGDDRILVLSTCASKSTSNLKDGRVVVFARRARIGETVSVDTTAIQENSDVIMPYKWYTSQNEKPHTYYLSQMTSTTTEATTTGAEDATSDSTEDTTVLTDEFGSTVATEEMTTTTTDEEETTTDEEETTTTEEKTTTTSDEEETTTTSDEEEEITSSATKKTTTTTVITTTTDEEETTTKTTEKTTTTKTTKKTTTTVTAATTTESSTKETSATKEENTTTEKETTTTKAETTEPTTEATEATEDTTAATGDLSEEPTQPSDNTTEE